METIKVQVSSELAEQLRPYSEQLPQILELGLRHLEQQQAASEMQQQTLAVLRRVGATGPDLDTMTQYLAEQTASARRPIKAGGKPASEMIIEERTNR
jgi:hypothetical protein